MVETDKTKRKRACSGKKSKCVRILGVDTALRKTGFGVIDKTGKELDVVDCGIIKTHAKAPLSECLLRLGGGMRELAEHYAPDVASIEGAFYFRNAKTAMLLGSARGAVITTLAELSIPMYEYSPRRTKQAVCGYGNASKEQVAVLVARLLNIDTATVPDDATDALALAICHALTVDALQGLKTPKQL